MKKCFKCGQQKPLDEFYRHPQMGDGHLNKCKECTKADTQAVYRSNRNRYRAYDKARNRRPERKTKRLEYQRASRARSPEKSRARQAVGKALRKGEIKKHPCIHCGSIDRLEAHHRDYSKPLEVVWVCFNCHRTIEHGDAFQQWLKRAS